MMIVSRFGVGALPYLAGNVRHSWGGQILPLAKSGENTLLNV